MFSSESWLTRNALPFVLALPLAASGCAAAGAGITEVEAPVAEGDAATSEQADDAATAAGMDAGQVTTPEPDAGMLPAESSDAAVPADSGASNVPCDLTVLETFEVDALPAGWMIANVGTPFSWQWLSGSTSIPNKTPSASKAGFYLVNSYDNKTPYDARLVSPAYPLSNCSSISMAFDQYLSVLNDNITGSVEVRIDHGAWQSVESWDTDYTGHEELDLSSLLVGKGKTFQLALRYEDPEGLGIYWQVDDLSIRAQ